MCMKLIPYNFQSLSLVFLLIWIEGSYEATQKHNYLHSICDHKVLTDNDELILNDIVKKEKCNIHHVAILVIGDSKPASFQKHSEEMVYHIVKPYNADLFVVTDAEGPPILKKMNLATSLPTIFGSSLKAVGLMGPITSQHIKDLLKDVEKNSSHYWKANNLVGKVASASIQWFRLFECWKSMEQYEKENRFFYDVVIKLRFDCTPLPSWNLCKNSEVFSSSSFRAIHACTDHVFWGLRNEMKVACYELWPAIRSYFETTHRNAYSRAFSISAMLNSMKNIQPLLQEEGWKHYNKVSTLPFLDMGIKPKLVTTKPPQPKAVAKKKVPVHGHRVLQSAEQNAQFQNMIDNLEKAHKLGMEYVDPMNQEASQVEDIQTQAVKRSINKQEIKTDHVYFNGYQVIRGLHSTYHGYIDGLFQTEKDFLVLLLMNNITVCDLGAGTNSVLYKGEVVCRPSTKCKEYVREGMLVPSLNDTNSSGFVISDTEKKFHDASKGKSVAEEYEAR